MRVWLRSLIVAVCVTTCLGCGGGGERGKNKDLDRPKPAEQG
jgi:hypothetical protein